MLNVAVAPSLSSDSDGRSRARRGARRASSTSELNSSLDVEQLARVPGVLHERDGILFLAATLPLVPKRFLTGTPRPRSGRSARTSPSGRVRRPSAFTGWPSTPPARAADRAFAGSIRGGAGDDGGDAYDRGGGSGRDVADVGRPGAHARIRARARRRMINACHRFFQKVKQVGHVEARGSRLKK